MSRHLEIALRVLEKRVLELEQKLAEMEAKSAANGEQREKRPYNRKPNGPTPDQ